MLAHVSFENVILPEGQGRDVDVDLKGTQCTSG